MESVATYWVEFPQGRFIREAVSMALDQLPTLKNCSPYSGFDAASPEALEKLRNSLRDVDQAVKRPLRDRLEEIAPGCREAPRPSAHRPLTPRA